MTIPGAPMMPSEMTDEQIEIWDYYCSMLVPIGCLGQQDGITLHRLVCAVCDYMEARRELTGDGRILTGPKGKKYRNPWALELKDTLAELKAAERSFGLSPATRAGIEVKKAVATIVKIT